MQGNQTIEELRFNDRFLDDGYKNSNYYREYLRKVFEELEEQTLKQ